MRVIAILPVLAGLFSASLAFTCNDPLLPECCATAANSPRGYVGTDCAKPSGDAENYTCNDSTRVHQLCCQQEQVLANGEVLAYYCAPRDGQ